MFLTSGATAQHRVFDELLLRDLVIPGRIMVQIFRNPEKISVIPQKLLDTRISLTGPLHVRFLPEQTQMPSAPPHFSFSDMPGMLDRDDQAANPPGAAYQPCTQYVAGTPCNAIVAVPLWPFVLRLALMRPCSLAEHP